MLTRAELTAWTSALRANPEQQGFDGLSNKDFTKFCCLGKLCEVQNAERHPDGGYYLSANPSVRSNGTLAGKIAQKFGSQYGSFLKLKMPSLKWQGEIFTNAAAANDTGVPWILIADHFDKYYPCSDEQ